MERFRPAAAAAGLEPSRGWSSVGSLELALPLRRQKSGQVTTATEEAAKPPHRFPDQKAPPDPPSMRGPTLYESADGVLGMGSRSPVQRMRRVSRGFQKLESGISRTRPSTHGRALE